MGITPTMFFDLSPREFYHMMKTHGEQRKQKLEYEMKQAYEVARFQATLLLAPHYKTPITDPKKLVIFSWEKQKAQTVEEMKTLLLGIARAANRKFKKKQKDGSTK